MPTSDQPNAIELRGAQKCLGRTLAVRDISFTVPQGSIFGFLGPNGAGKTTTLRLLVGAIRLDDGCIQLLGHDPWRDRVGLHARLGYVPAGAATFRGMRGIDVLDHMAALSRSGSPSRRHLLDAFEFASSDLVRPVGDYSKGMRQKLAIIHAMQHDPELLLLDEPSDGLDPLMQHALYGVLRERAAAGVTVLFSSHALAEVEQLCEHVAIVRQGTSVIQATLDELRAKRPRVVRLRPTDPGSLDDLPSSFAPAGQDAEGRTVFHVTDGPDDIIRVLAGMRLQDVLIEEPSLDDVFRSYYTGEEEDR